MLTQGGGRKPSDVFGSAVVEGLWPEDSAIAQIKQVGEKFRGEASRRLERAGELDNARGGIMDSIQSVNAEAMYERLAKITRDQNALVDNAAEIYKGAEELARECGDLQLSLVSVVEAHRPDWDAAIQSGLQQIAAVVLATAKGKASTAAAESAAWITQRGAEITTRMTMITPASWGPGGAESPPTTDGSGGSPSPTIQAVSNESGRVSESEGEAEPGDDRPGQLSENEAESTGVPEETAEDAPGRVATDEVDSSAPRENEGPPRPASGGLSSGGSGASSLGGLPSSSGGSGSAGGGTPSMGGTGSPPSLSESGLSSAAGQGAGSGAMSPGALMGAGSAPSSAAGGGSGAGSGARGVRIPPPPPISASSAPPASTAATAPPVSAVPASAGGFGQAGTSGAPAAGAHGGGGMPMGAPMAPAVPPPAHPGPAPTASPGLTQGSAAAAPSAAGSAGAVGSAGAAGVAAASAAPYSAAAPKQIDHYGQMAVEAVKVLAPAAARLPGLVVAVAVVSSRGGHPQLVMATNDGAGFMPDGFFLPSGMIHAFTDLNSPDFARKWFGWTDPTRTLLDYAVARGQSSGDGLQVLGLASSAQVSGETKEIFPNAVPVVRPDPDAQPLTEDGGRNTHRLKAIAPLPYSDLLSATEKAVEQAAVRATQETMKVDGAAPLRAATGPWGVIESGRPLEPAEWQALRSRYNELLGTYGALRPGFMTGDITGQMARGYKHQFQLVRAIEVLLHWESAPRISARDIIYCAQQAGADVNGLFR